MALAETTLAAPSGQTPVSVESSLASKSLTSAPAAGASADLSSPEILTERQQLWLTGFIFVNVGLFQIVARLPVFDSVAHSLIGTANAASLALLLLLGTFAFTPVVQSIWRAAWPKSGSAHFEAADALRLFGFCLVLVAAFLGSNQIEIQVWELSLLPFVVLFERMVSRSIACEVASTKIGVNPDARARVLVFKDNVATETWMAAREVEIGQVVRVRAGECVPLDGQIISGVAELEEQRFSRSGGLRLRMSGDEVFSGSPLHLGQIEIKVTNSLADAVITTFINEAETGRRAATTENERFLTAGVWLTLVATFAAVCGVIAIERGVSSANALMLVAAAALAPVYARYLEVFQDFPALLRRAAFNRGVHLRESLETFKRLTQCRTFIADSGVMLGEGWRVAEVVLLDQRFDRLNFLGLVRSLLSRAEFISRSSDESHAEGLIYEKIEQYVRAQDELVPLFEVRDFAEYTGLGMHANVRGADISLGTEEFLIERGVTIETGDVIETNQQREVLYFSINADLVGRIELVRGGTAEGEALVSQLRQDGIKFRLCSTAPATSVDALGKELGLELASIFGGLTREQYVDKIKSAKPVAVSLERSSDAALRSAADISIAPFDDFTWDLERTDITVFGRGINALSQPFTLARRVQQSERGARLCGLGLQLALLILVPFGIGPVVVGLFSLAFSLYLALQLSTLLGEKNFLEINQIS